MSYETEMEESVYELEEELEAAEAVILQLRPLLDAVRAVAFGTMDDKYKVSEIRQLLYAAGEAYV